MSIEVQRRLRIRPERATSVVPWGAAPKVTVRSFHSALARRTRTPLRELLSA